MSRITEFKSNLREFSLTELRDKLVELKEDLFNLRFQLATGSLDKNHRIREVKKDIARVHTVIREIERAESAKES